MKNYLIVYKYLKAMDMPLTYYFSTDCDEKAVKITRLFAIARNTDWWTLTELGEEDNELVAYFHKELGGGYSEWPKGVAR